MHRGTPLRMRGYWVSVEVARHASFPADSGVSTKQDAVGWQVSMEGALESSALRSSGERKAAFSSLHPPPPSSHLLQSCVLPLHLQDHLLDKANEGPLSRH